MPDLARARKPPTERAPTAGEARRDAGGGAERHPGAGSTSQIVCCGAGLLLSTFAQLGRMDLGFRSSNVLTFEAHLPDGRYDSMVIGAAAALLGVIGLLAAYVPARRATAVDPRSALS